MADVLGSTDPPPVDVPRDAWQSAAGEYLAMSQSPPVRSRSFSAKPDFEECMARVHAWYGQRVLDRPPVRFHHHNMEYERRRTVEGPWRSPRERWMDVDFQVEAFLESLEGTEFLGETFPVFWPNLGPGVYAALFGCRLAYGEVTAWSEPLIRDWSDVARLRLDREGRHFRALEAMTRLALERARGRYLVGYTDFHPGLDCAADWRGVNALCLDIIDAPERVKGLVDIAASSFGAVFDHFDAMAKAAGHPSVTWMAIPSSGKMHIPSCDVAFMLSPRHFEEFGLPAVLREVRRMDRNIFHVDGKGVARHLDRILAIPEVAAIQWVQGMGADKPILQWLPLIDRIRAAGKSVLIDLELEELEELIGRTRPEGLFLCISAPRRLRPEIVRRVERWR